MQYTYKRIFSELCLLTSHVVLWWCVHCVPSPSCACLSPYNVVRLTNPLLPRKKKCERNRLASMTNKQTGEGALCYSCSGTGALGVAPMSIEWAKLLCPHLLRPPWLLLCLVKPELLPSHLIIQTLLHSPTFVTFTKVHSKIQIYQNPPLLGARFTNPYTGRCVAKIFEHVWECSTFNPRTNAL